MQALSSKPFRKSKVAALVEVMLY